MHQAQCKLFSPFFEWIDFCASYKRGIDLKSFVQRIRLGVLYFHFHSVAMGKCSQVDTLHGTSHVVCWINGSHSLTHSLVRRLPSGGVHPKSIPSSEWIKMSIILQYNNNIILHHFLTQVVQLGRDTFVLALGDYLKSYLFVNSSLLLLLGGGSGKGQTWCVPVCCLWQECPGNIHLLFLWQHRSHGPSWTHKLDFNFLSPVCLLTRAKLGPCGRTGTGDRANKKQTNKSNSNANFPFLHARLHKSRCMHTSLNRTQTGTVSKNGANWIRIRARQSRQWHTFTPRRYPWTSLASCQVKDKHWPHNRISSIWSN